MPGLRSLAVCSLALTLPSACSSTSRTTFVDRDSATAGASGAAGSTAGSGGSAGVGGASGAASDAAAGAGGTSGADAAAPPDGGATDASAGPCSDVCGTPGCGTCPSSVAIDVGGYSIGATEVTVAEYAAFLAVAPAPSTQPTFCAWNSSYVPSAGWPPVGLDDHPVSLVDWCDAWAYCRWAGKRLCGRIGGGPNGYNEHANASASEWYAACSSGGSRVYPYGDTYDGTRCNSQDYGAGSAIPVGSAVRCEGGTPGLFDMSGNVYEWDAACVNATGGNDLCRVRGGSYAFVPFGANLRCDNDYAVTRSTTLPDLGIRCCES